MNSEHHQRRDDALKVCNLALINLPPQGWFYPPRVFNGISMEDYFSMYLYDELVAKNLDKKGKKGKILPIDYIKKDKEEF